MFSTESPVPTVVCGFLSRYAVQGLVAAALRSAGIKFAEFAQKPGQRRLVEQRLARAVIGGVAGASGVSMALGSAALRERMWHGNHPGMLFLIRYMLGYFASDTVEILYARRKFRAPLQMDLLLHHLVGAYIEFGIHGLFNHNTKGHFYYGLSISAELLTLLSGTSFFLTACDATAYPSLATWLNRISKARLWSIALFRLPFWTCLFGHVVQNVVHAIRKGDQRDQEGIPAKEGSQVGVIIMFLILMDCYWVRMLLRAAAKAKSGTTSKLV